VNPQDVQTTLSLKPSLRDKLMRHVLVPLAIVWMIGTLLSAGIANYFAQKAFDRSLLDDAYAVAGHVRLTDAWPPQLDIDLSSSEIGSLLFDQTESMYFAVYRENGTLLAGHGGLNGPAEAIGAKSNIEFGDIHFQGRAMRSVVLQQSKPASYKVVVAQTNRSRTRLLEQLLLYSILPQMLLFAGIAVWLRRAIAGDLQPLVNLEEAVEQRDAADLTPMVVASDTQDVDKLNTSINALLARIQDGLNAQREFSGNVAHELRTPLAGIRALAEYGLQSDQPQAWREQLALIKESSMRASHLANQLLALALADEADLSLRREPVRLDELITTCIVQASARARSLQVDLGATGLEHAVSVIGNATLIEGILNNLIDNALRYGRPSGLQSAVVTVCLTQSAEGVALIVMDNGPGLATEECERLLQRGAQGQQGKANHGLHQGAGFGLSIVTRYAQLLGAQFWLQNSANHPGLEAHIVFANPSSTQGP
jgi:two-component system sensor histidine kinase TctE